MKKSDIAPNAIVAVPTIPVICEKCRLEGSAGDPMFMGIPEILNFEPVPRRNQVNAWTPEHQRAFIAGLAISGSARKAAAAIGRHQFGADQLRKARGGRGFSEAWDAALDIARERELARVYENLAQLNDDADAQNARGEPEASGDIRDVTPEECEAASASIRRKLLYSRRLYLASICGDDDKRAAWEVLAGPVDWEKAKALQPQDNEPYGMPNAHKLDVLLPGEAGFLGDAAGGRDVKAELRDAVAEYRATGSLDGPAMRRLEG